jgi:hypothetical protein
MEKIPTLFERNDKFKVIDKIHEGCDWVIRGEGQATEKLDGMNMRLTVQGGMVVKVEKRRNPTRDQKKAGIVDGWYVDAKEADNNDKWLFDAVRNTDVSSWPDGEHSVEALGPSIQGNPLGLDRHVCVPFNLKIPVYENVPRTFDGLKMFIATEALKSIYSPHGNLAEGIVFHHPDGRRAKIKRKDF